MSTAISRSRRRVLRGFTLIELIVSIAILSILTGLAVPMTRVAIKRQKERELRYDLQLLRDAIDRYKHAAEGSYFQKADSYTYPKSLNVLVEGVEITGGKKLRFLRQIPIDPMTGKNDWGVHSMDDEPESDSWDESTIYDVYSRAEGIGLDGTRYRTW
jgi:general secretion pathway protein G